MTHPRELTAAERLVDDELAGDSFVVATVFGVGSVYTIHGRPSSTTARFDVVGASGPAENIVARDVSWVDAMNVVRDAVESQMADEGFPS